MLEPGYILEADGRTYRITELIGKGANTAAYLAERISHGLVSRCILKEYAPNNKNKLTAEEFASGKSRFIASGKLQNDKRRTGSLTNQTPPVSCIFEANGTAYIDVTCYGGNTLSRLQDLSLQQYMEICRTIAKTVGYYHKAGYLCLDVKPENIFVLQNAPDDTVTQLVEFIDFDSIRKISELGEGAAISCTKGWAAPEQLNAYSSAGIGIRTDIYTIGELVFYFLFGRHSAESEHRGFSRYDFSGCRKDFKKYVARPDIQALFTKIFRGTIRSSAANRFSDMSEVEGLLSRLLEALYRKDYVVPRLPAVSPVFLGRASELKTARTQLEASHVFFIYGLGGIGKSTIARNYIQCYKAEYDVIVYMEYTGDIIRTFADDRQLQLSNLRRQSDEGIKDYFDRKLAAFSDICTDKRVLMVIDNFSGLISKDMSRMLDYGYDVIITTRNEPPKNSFASLEVTAIPDTAKLFELVSLNMGRTLVKVERECFEEIFRLVHGHTLTLELIARQINAGHMDVQAALELIRANGFSHISDDKISNYKDGEESYGTLFHIISCLFDAGNMSSAARIVLKVLSMMDVMGLDSFVISDYLKLDMDVLHGLVQDGWVYEGTWLGSGSYVRLHPVISETVRNWDWDDAAKPGMNRDPDGAAKRGKNDNPHNAKVGNDTSTRVSITGADGIIRPYDLAVMKYYKDMADVYVGAGNAGQLDLISKEAARYAELHPRHIVKSVYHDIHCSYLDVTCVEYVPENAEQADHIVDTINEMFTAIDEAEASSDSLRERYLVKYYLDLAMLLIRGTPDGGDEAAALLSQAYDLMAKINEPDISDNRCYYNMISAWYHTLIKPDLCKTIELTGKAREIAFKVFPTELEIIDIIYIPTANCLYFHGDLEGAVKVLDEAVSICKKYADTVRYMDKLLDLWSIEINVYMDLGDILKCRHLLSEIDRMNDMYKDIGVFLEISNEIREKLT
ncbi:MAG: serine/threonine protein kinase [Lachnospiraceae bacterium]|nr:serine/threonine protein kinase [Lachnospiraceae bacterium]